MKKLLQLALAFSAIPICATGQVSVSTTQYTSQELVNTVLLGSSCYQATNVTSSTGTDFGSVNGIGYFQNDNSDFPFQNGIILSNGDALTTAGPYTGMFMSGGSGEWLGDSDINTFLYSGTTYTSRNASVLEFDFIAYNQEISLDYIFASNEYGMYQCGWGDGVVILLKDITEETTYINMATIPGTIVPVSVQTVRSNLYNNVCPSMNQEFYGNYYPVPAPETAPINLRGDTKVLTASASAIPGHTYHLKIAISDMNDGLFDSAVFIRAGSLNIGPFSNFHLSAQGDNLCSSEGVNLTTNLGTGFSYEWSLNGITLSETQPSLSLTTAGEYSVIATHALTGCSETRSIIVEAGVALPIAINLPDLVVFDENNDGFATFDLTVQTTNILNQTGATDDYTVYYFETPEDAEYGTNAIANPYAYTNISNYQQTLYALVLKTATGCYEVFSFNIIAATIPEAPTGSSEQSFTQGETLADLEVEGENIQWYDNSGEGMPDFPDGTSQPLPLTKLLVDGETYYASQTINGVESSQRLAVTVNLILGNDDFIFNGLRYYPNPANNVLNIENAVEINSVSIVNALGQKVITKTVNGKAVQIDVTSLSKGIYFVTVNSGSASKTIKIITE